MVTDSYRRLPKTGERMTPAQYDALETLFPGQKYEYLGGMIRLMAGGSREHDQISFNVRAAIDINFRSGPCFVSGSDLKVLIADGQKVYPDVAVSCNVDDRRRGNKLMRSPHLIVEVLSPSTEHADRNAKLQAYQAIPTIQEIVLVNQFSPLIEVYRRTEEQSWTHIIYEAWQDVMLESIDVSISMQDIYRKIDFDEPLEEES